MKSGLRNQKGFTLVEIIAVLILLGILAAVAVPRYVDLAASAEGKAMDAGVAELNSRESLEWANLKLSDAGYVLATSDAALLAIVVDSDTTLGDDYTLNSGTATVTAVDLTFGSVTETLVRTISTTASPASYTRP